MEEEGNQVEVGKVGEEYNQVEVEEAEMEEEGNQAEVVEVAQQEEGDILEEVAVCMVDWRVQLLAARQAVVVRQPSSLAGWSRMAED